MKHLLIVLSLVAFSSQAADAPKKPVKQQTVTAKTVEVKAKKPTKKVEKKVEPKKVEPKKEFDPNRKVPTLKKKYRKEEAK
jgi:hypothetical protein